MLRRFLASSILLCFAAIALAQQSKPAPDADGYYSVGEGINPPKPIHPSPAVFPNDPRLAGLKYSRIIAASIDATGKLVESHLVSTNPGPFDASALAAVQGLAFEPAKLHGIPVPVRVQIWVPFVPNEPRAVPEVMPLKFNGFKKDDRPPKALNTPEAVFSDEARRARTQGVVVMSVIITDKGEMEDLHIVKPLGHGLDEKAMEAARQYRFAPALRWGIPVPHRIKIEINFRL